jgi:colanic acid biosynthesis glycosyl transferase WcaI
MAKASVRVDRCHNPLRVAGGLENQFVVGCAGNLGRAHEIETVLEAMKALYERSIASPADETAKPIKFLFIGGGSLRPRLEDEARLWGLGNVQFHGYQPREQLASALCAADLHLVILNPKLDGLIVPSKIYAITAAGRPVIFIGDRSGEIARTCGRMRRINRLPSITRTDVPPGAVPVGFVRIHARAHSYFTCVGSGPKFD